MIIDCILDRHDGEMYGREYSPHDFYFDCMEYSRIFNGIGDDITKAMDYGEEEDVRKALCDYIDHNEYNPKIKEYINARNWLDREKYPEGTDFPLF